MINENIPQIAKQTADVVSYGAVVGAFLGYLPTIAAALSVIWISIQIWESKTFKRVFRRKK